MSEYPLTEKVKTNSSVNETERFYVYGPTGLIAIIDNNTNYFVVKDHLGSIREVLDKNSSPVSYYIYNPFGDKISTTVHLDSKYQFTGQEFDTESGLFNFRARMYDSRLGLFYSMDPAGQNYSPFSYCGNNPVIRVDRDGKIFCFFPLIVGAIVGLHMGNQIAIANNANGWARWGYVLGGGLIGAGSGYLGYNLGTSGGIMANTLGMVASSFTNSVSLSLLSGQNMAQVNFGLGSFSFHTGKVDWAFGNNNFLQDVVDGMDVINVLNDVYAAAFVPYEQVAVAEKAIEEAQKNTDKPLVLRDRLAFESPKQTLLDNWNWVGEDDSYYSNQLNNLGFTQPPLGRFINGPNKAFRIGRWHIGRFKPVGGQDFVSTIHSDYFDINKNLLWHAFEWLITPPNPRGAQK